MAAEDKFKLVDADGDNELSKDELYDMLTVLKIPIEPGDLDK